MCPLGRKGENRTSRLSRALAGEDFLDDAGEGFFSALPGVVDKFVFFMPCHHSLFLREKKYLDTKIMTMAAAIASSAGG